LSKDSMRSFRELCETIDHVEIDSGSCNCCANLLRTNASSTKSIRGF
jgi:hypothetical protein